MVRNGSGCPDPTYDIKDEGRRTVKVSRRMQVVNLYEHHILLKHATGVQESYQYNDFLQRLDRR